mmetsp:Transcript_19958/g.67116  ORF Transcript_19958/g.67116 Transcript_19958/m.67116 type:complete len:253 (+) Transcript_19958:1264-2022(+)
MTTMASRKGPRFAPSGTGPSWTNLGSMVRNRSICGRVRPSMMADTTAVVDISRRAGRRSFTLARSVDVRLMADPPTALKTLFITPPLLAGGAGALVATVDWKATISLMKPNGRMSTPCLCMAPTRGSSSAAGGRQQRKYRQSSRRRSAAAPCEPSAMSFSTSALSWADGRPPRMASSAPTKRSRELLRILCRSAVAMLVCMSMLRLRSWRAGSALMADWSCCVDWLSWLSMSRVPSAAAWTAPGPKASISVR